MKLIKELMYRNQSTTAIKFFIDFHLDEYKDRSKYSLEIFVSDTILRISVYDTKED